MRRYLIDTAIWIDLYEDRKGYNDEPLGEYASKLISFIRSTSSKIILTELILKELETRLSLEQVNGLFLILHGHIETSSITSEQRAEANRLAEERQVPPSDAAHAITARDTGSILVSRDRHFRILEDVTPCYRPEDLI